MSIGPSRFIAVDDTSPVISYQGPWTEGAPTTTQLGRPFNDTLHELTGSGSLSFSFTGSSVSVIGSFMSPTLPSWACFVDGFALISNNISDIDLLNNNVEICSLQNIVIKPTPSNLTVVATGTADVPFLFDHIQYAPDGSTSLDNATVIVDAFDNQIQYDSGWNKLESIGMETLAQNASLTFDFVGIQITWITTVAFNPNTTVNGSAQYSIDNGTFFPIQVAAHNSTIQTYDLVSFQTPELSPGLHRLCVLYGFTNESSAPLVLDHFLIQNLTIPTFTPTPPTPTSSTSSSTSPGSAASAQIPTSTQTHYNARLSKGAVGGIVIGTLIGAVIIFILVIRFIKRRSAAADPQPGYAAYQDYGDGQR
ncbi:hypothetical protein M413DRAFT_410625 [Hebeloma cylindrosporum]|uniref:Uncharacterized protein n=1 Tax=Hebeloma cylindrosporum TaxID=76867 RepID=A0A0C3BZJ9_HEBCY|nr:hypothetical protein M413DRAFT_410625 [Hebeloma cylindrosporum h7]